MPFLNPNPDQIIRDILTGAELYQKSHVVQLPNRLTLPPELDGKSSPMAISLVNLTQFRFSPGPDYNEWGTFCTSPQDVEPFSVMTFCVCARKSGLDNFLDDFTTEHLQGVSGGMTSTAFGSDRIEYGGTFQIGFSNPLIGSIKASVITNSSKEEAYLHAVDTPTDASLGPYQGTNTQGKAVTLSLSFQCIPGPHTSVFIIQKVQEA